MKVGVTRKDLNEREQSYVTDGVFVFAVSFDSADDAELIEAKLKRRYKCTTAKNKQEFFNVARLQSMFCVPSPAEVLPKFQGAIEEMLKAAVFKHTARDTIHKATS
jgi:hypothetical protein